MRFTLLVLMVVCASVAHAEDVFINTACYEHSDLATVDEFRKQGKIPDMVKQMARLINDGRCVTTIMFRDDIPPADKFDIREVRGYPYPRYSVGEALTAFFGAVLPPKRTMFMFGEPIMAKDPR